MEDEKILSEEITEEKNKSRETEEKDSGYERYCQMCKRPESVVGS